MTRRQQLIRDVSNRLLIALGISFGVFIAGSLTIYSFQNFVPGGTPLMALMVGFIGGFVGVQKRLRALPDDDLELMSQSWVYTLLSPLVGGILSALTYVLFISGLLSGDLFPQFVADDTADAVQGLPVLFRVHGEAKDYAKLIFWCFLAGYSERFATNILSQFEARESRPNSGESAAAPPP